MKAERFSSETSSTKAASKIIGKLQLCVSIGQGRQRQNGSHIFHFLISCGTPKFVHREKYSLKVEIFL